MNVGFGLGVWLGFGLGEQLGEALGVHEGLGEALGRTAVSASGIVHCSGCPSLGRTSILSAPVCAP